MAGVMDSVELLELLDSSDTPVFHEVRKFILDNLNNNKEAWLVNALIDSFTVSRSSRCLEIINKITEPHDKQVLDRLLDHMKGAVNHKMESLVILSSIIRHEPLWLHKICSHPLLAQVLKCLKTDTDVSILMIGCLAVTALLPVVPVTIGSYLADIFEIFFRLTSIAVKRAGVMERSHLLHVHVGIECMFHRFYGMYPCNFLAYLRSVYSKPENSEIFQVIVKPLLNQVRMHPLLVTAAKDKELSMDRWKELEVHDVLVECGQLSLDPVGVQLLDNPTHSKPDLSKNSADKLHIGGGSVLAATVDPSNVWSPSRVTGLTTPPTVQTTATSGSNTARLNETSGKKELTILNSPLRRLTALNTSGDGPPPSPRLFHTADPPSQPSTPRQDKTDPALNSESTIKSAAACKLTFETPPVAEQQKDLTDLNLSGKHSTRPSTAASEADTAVQPSQQAASSAGPETPGSAASVQPSRSAISSAGPDTPGSAAAGQTVSLVAAENADLLMAAVSRTTVSTQTSQTEAVESEDHHTRGNKSSERITGGISVSVSTDDKDGINKSSRHNKPAASESAAIMAALMKRVKRIRYDSNRERCSGVSWGTMPRSESTFGSCPNLSKISEGWNTGTSSDSGGEEMSDGGEGMRGLLVRQPSDRPGGVSRSSLTTLTVASVGLSPVVSSVVSVETQTSFYKLLYDSSKDPLVRGGCKMAVEEEEEMNEMVGSEMERLFGFLQPHAPFVTCYSCATEKAKCFRDASDVEYGALALKTGSVTPMYLSYSPKDILDQYIVSSCALHEKLYNKAKEESEAAAQLSSSYSGNSSKTGSTPVSASGSSSKPGSTSSTAAGQSEASVHVNLLHNLLLFTQHRQEVHARRNRRLLGRAVKVVSLEEQNSAMKDQLRLQEEEMANHHQAFKNLLQHNADLRGKVERLTKEKRELDEKTTEHMSLLQEKVKNLEESLTEQKSLNEELVRKLDHTNNTLFSKSKELELVTTKAESASMLKEQVNRLNREILLMGELHSKYQQRLSTVNSSPAERAQAKNFMQAAKNECIELKQALKDNMVQLKSEQTKSSKHETHIKEKESCIIELKKLLESIKASHYEQIKILEEKIKAERSSFLSEQSRVLELTGELEAIKLHPPIRAGKHVGTCTSPLSPHPPSSPTHSSTGASLQPGGGPALTGEASTNRGATETIHKPDHSTT